MRALASVCEAGTVGFRTDSEMIDDRESLKVSLSLESLPLEKFESDLGMSRRYGRCVRELKGGKE